MSKYFILSQSKIGHVGERRRARYMFFKVPECLFCLTLKNELELLLNVKSCITRTKNTVRQLSFYGCPTFAGGEVQFCSAKNKTGKRA